MSLISEIKNCIEEQIKAGKKRYIIFPYGDVGMQVKTVLKECYAITNIEVFDNHLCEFNPDIKPLKDISSYLSEDSVVLFAITNIELYQKLKWLLQSIWSGDIAELQCVRDTHLLPIKSYEETAVCHFSKGIESFKRKCEENGGVCLKGKCTGCSACANVCPSDAIRMEVDEEGFVYPKIISDKCINCGKCSFVCPALHVKTEHKIIPLASYAAYSKNEETRYMSTSGGAFSEIAQVILKDGGICYGAAYNEDLSVAHMRITGIQELPLLRQSKYLQSRIDYIFRNVKADLSDGKKVLFVGTPCQCVGLQSYLEKKYENLILVDFICHSVCSPKAYEAYLKELETIYGKQVSRVWFKNKETTWNHFSLRVDFKEETEYYRQTNGVDAYFEAFLRCRVISRPSCHNCQFKGFDRVSDFTLADFWGLRWKNDYFGQQEMRNGVSLVIINSVKAQKLFNEKVMQNMFVEEHDFDEAVSGNMNYYNSQEVGDYRDAFWKNIDRIPFGELVWQLKKQEGNVK